MKKLLHPKSELRVRISDDVLKALKLAVVRLGTKTPTLVEQALKAHAPIRAEWAEMK